MKNLYVQSEFVSKPRLARYMHSDCSSCCKTTTQSKATKLEAQNESLDCWECTDISHISATPSLCDVCELSD